MTPWVFVQPRGFVYILLFFFPARQLFKHDVVKCSLPEYDSLPLYYPR
jgi:hypothetical protein